uniref:Inosine/uridine-preferring nucleoside hydrolase domain-containing protein n=1 Tax=Oncorhynchus tshawytscha TaxID=74940 RepID=A0AAZ3P2L8_ONCTS
YICSDIFDLSLSMMALAAPNNVCNNTLRVLQACNRLEVQCLWKNVVSSEHFHGPDIVDTNVSERSLVATAPLTNLALAVRMEPSLPSQLKGLYIMGDNTECKGNTTVCAEYNFDRHHGSKKACFIARIFRNTMEESYSEHSQAQMVDSMGLVSCDSYAMAAAIDDAFVTVRATTWRGKLYYSTNINDIKNNSKKAL